MANGATDSEKIPVIVKWENVAPTITNVAGKSAAIGFVISAALNMSSGELKKDWLLPLGVGLVVAEGLRRDIKNTQHALLNGINNIGKEPKAPVFPKLPQPSFPTIPNPLANSFPKWRERPSAQEKMNERTVNIVAHGLIGVNTLFGITGLTVPTTAITLFHLAVGDHYPGGASYTMPAVVCSLGTAFFTHGGLSAIDRMKAGVAGLSQPSGVS